MRYLFLKLFSVYKENKTFHFPLRFVSQKFDFSHAISLIRKKYNGLGH